MFIRLFKKKVWFELHNLLSEIIKFKEYQKEWSEDFPNDILEKIQSFNTGIAVDWDSNSGEEWALIIKGRDVIGIIAAKIPLAFINDDLFYQFKFHSPKIFTKIYCVKVNEFDKKDWFVDLKEFKLEIPELEWHACHDAVNPEAFSINDFFYATIWRKSELGTNL